MIRNYGRVPSYPQTRRQADQLAAAGDLTGARALLEQAVELGRPGLAAGDPELLATMRQLAGLLASGGDPAGARRLLEEAQAAGHRLGPADPLLVLLAYDLAVVADELGNRHEARKNFALVAEHGPAALGPGHPAVVHAREDASPVPSAPPVSPAPPAFSAPPASPVFSAPPASPVFSAPPALPAGPGPGPRHSRTPWIVAAAAVVFAVVMLVVVLVRPGAQPDAAAPAAAPATASPLPLGPLPLPSVTLPSAAAPSPSAARLTPSATRVAPSAARGTTPAPKPSASPRATTAKPAATRITTPATGARVPREFTVKFSLSRADATARRTEVLTRGRLALYVGATTVLIVAVAALAALDAERGHPGSTIGTYPDALWWAVVTITTVGYGDLAPVTAEGRLVALAMMIGGIGLIGFVTGSLASWIVDRIGADEQEHGATHRDVAGLLAEIRELRADVAALRAEVRHSADPD